MVRAFNFWVLYLSISKVASLTYCLVLFGSSLLSQHNITLAGVAGSTGYSLLRKPKNGLALLAVSGLVGTTADMLYGWKYACKKEVSRFYVEREKEYSNNSGFGSGR